MKRPLHGGRQPESEGEFVSGRPNGEARGCDGTPADGVGGETSSPGWSSFLKLSFSGCKYNPREGRFDAEGDHDAQREYGRDWVSWSQDGHLPYSCNGKYILRKENKVELSRKLFVSL